MIKGLTKNDIEGVQALSGLQLSMLYRSRSDPDGGHYVEQLAFEFSNFNAAAMQSSINQIIQRHRALRSLFIWREQEEPKLLVLRKVESLLESSALTSQANLLAHDRARGIALDTAPMMRMTMVDLGSGLTRCVWSLHHAVVDGWSIIILQNELLSLYRAYCNESSLPAPVEDKAPHPQAFKPSKSWLDILHNPPKNPLGNSIPSPSLNAPDFADLGQLIASDSSSLIKSWCRRNKVTFASFAHCTWALLLAHISSCDDVLFGSIDNGRGQPEVGESAVGMFMMLKPIRLHIEESEPVALLMQNYQREQWRLMPELPPKPVELAQLLGISSDENLFDSVLIVQNVSTPQNFDDIGLLTVSGFEQADAPLTISIVAGDTIEVLFRYQAALLNGDTVTSLLNVFIRMMHSIAASECQLTIGESLDHISESTGVTLKNQSALLEPDQTHIVDRFVSRVQSQPNAIALIDEQTTTTYHTLSQQAESIRQQLLEHDISKGDVVGIHLSRSKECIAAMLAVMALDACYLPLDPHYPNASLSFMLEDASAVVVLSNNNAIFPITTIQPTNTIGATTLSISQALVSESLCLIYTSGSTGKPKGVFLQHKAISNRLQWMDHQYPYLTSEVCCHRTPVSFVDSVCEIFSPLCAGVTSVIISDSLLTRLNDWICTIKERKISRLTLTPSLLNALLDTLLESETTLPQVRLCVVSGEALSANLSKKFYRALSTATLVNLYGSTEVTADALAYEVPPSPSQYSLEPIGAPISNLSAYVTNVACRKLPVGIIGELVIDGVAVAGGYLARPELTACKFNNDKFDTGDLAFIDTHGVAHYQGRIDRQIKVRGQRVEPGAIEAKLLQLNGIERVAVVENNSALVAVYVGSQTDVISMQEKLGESLPNYSIPERFVQIASLPKLANGKVDYKHLQDLAAKTKHTQHDQTETPLYAKQLALTVGNIWQDLLPDAAINERSHFFDSGGHSLLAMQMIARTERALGCSVALPLLVNNPILIDFSKALISESTVLSKSEIITLRRGDPKHAHALICIHGDAYNIVPHIADQRSIYWISQWAKRMELTKHPAPLESETISQLAERYADMIALKRPNGGYDLLGSCGAAVVCIEIATILARRGKPAANLILMDLPKGELSSPAFRQLSERDNESWLLSLYHYTYRKLGGEAFAFRRTLRAIEKKIQNTTPLSDAEAKHYTDAQLYSALHDYKPTTYTGEVQLVFSGRWRRGVEDPATVSVPTFWSDYLPHVRGFHFSPVQNHNDLLQGVGAAFAADVVCLNSNQ